MKKRLILTVFIIFSVFIFAENKKKPLMIDWRPVISKSWEESWEIESKRGFGIKENISILKEDNENFFRIKYPKGSLSSGYSKKMNTPLGGAQFYKELSSEGVDYLELSYQLRFSDNFNFVKGGKLPGLYGGDKNASGKRIPSEDSGFSTRFMWRTDGKGVIYAYLPTSENHGTDLGKWQFEKNVWHSLKQKIYLNTPGKSDGKIEVYLNDKQVANIENMFFRINNNLKINGLFFSTFFGGSDETWASTDDVYIDFKNFKISNSTLDEK